VSQQEIGQNQQSESKLLELEYQHATQNLFSVEELRNGLFRFYTIVTGSVITISQIPGIWTQGVAGLAFLAFAFGIVTVAALARLRMVTIASYQAQTLIRQYYIKHHPEVYRQDLRNALLWDELSVPKKERLLSYSFLSSFSVTFLNSVVLGISIYEGLQSLPIAASTAVAVCGIQIWIYLAVLNREMAESRQTGRFQEKLAALRK